MTDEKLEGTTIMINDDGDIVKGLGFLTMYFAWVEDDVDNLLFAMHSIEPFDEREQRWPIRRKLNHATELVRRLNDEELEGLPEALEHASELFERRNEAVHGRIYAEQDREEYIKSGRPNVPTRPVSSEEFYQLANDVWDFRGALMGPLLYRLPRAIERFLTP